MTPEEWEGMTPAEQQAHQLRLRLEQDDAERARAAARQRRLARPEDFVFDKQQERFWDTEDGTLHTEKGVNAAIPMEFWRVLDAGLNAGEAAGDAARGAPDRARRGRPAAGVARLQAPAAWISRVENDHFVEAATWWPGRPKIIEDLLVEDSGFRVALGRRLYNQYRPPPARAAGVNAEDAVRWVEHVKRLWPSQSEHEYFFDYCAHMVQHPEEKCNTAIVLSGAQGIGKDAALSAVKAAVGSWNCRGIAPDQLFDAFRPWIQTLMLVVDEVRPANDELHASSMYNILKPMIAAPPDTLPLNDKYAKLRYVVNVMRVFLTTNDWMSMYIPPEDRRMFIMHSTLQKNWHIESLGENYFVEFFEWLLTGGAAAVAVWLADRDISGFNPKAESVKTAGWTAVSHSWGVPDDAITAVLERMDRPDVFFVGELLTSAFDDRDEILGFTKSPRKLMHRLQREGYVAVRNPTDETRWTFNEGGRVYRSRTAFAKSAVTNDPRTCHEKIRARGRRMAAESKDVTLTVVKA